MLTIPLHNWPLVFVRQSSCCLCVLSLLGQSKNVCLNMLTQVLQMLLQGKQQMITRSQTFQYSFVEVKDGDGTGALQSHVGSSVFPPIHNRVHNELVLRTVADTSGLKGKRSHLSIHFMNLIGFCSNINNWINKCRRCNFTWIVCLHRLSEVCARHMRWWWGKSVAVDDRSMCGQKVSKGLMCGNLFSWKPVKVIQVAREMKLMNRR